MVGGDQPLIVIPASVAGRGPYEFVLDTGAGTSLLSPRLANDLGIVVTGSKVGAGAGGRVTVALGKAASLTIGGAYRAPWPVAITAEVDRIARRGRPPHRRCIGYDVPRIPRRHDYRHRQVRLAQGAFDAVGPRTGPRSRSASPRPQAAVMIPTFINVKAVRVRRGYRSPTSVISPQLARTLGIDRGSSTAVTAPAGCSPPPPRACRRWRGRCRARRSRRGRLAFVVTSGAVGTTGTACSVTTSCALRVTIDYRTRRSG